MTHVSNKTICNIFAILPKDKLKTLSCEQVTKFQSHAFFLEVQEPLLSQLGPLRDSWIMYRAYRSIKLLSASSICPSSSYKIHDNAVRCCSDIFESEILSALVIRLVIICVLGLRLGLEDGNDDGVKVGALLMLGIADGAWDSVGTEVGRPLGLADGDAEGREEGMDDTEGAVE